MHLDVTRTVATSASNALSLDDGGTCPGIFNAKARQDYSATVAAARAAQRIAAERRKLAA